jgi:hypothetical protein
MLRIARCVDGCLTDGGEVASLSQQVYIPLCLGIFVVLFSTGGLFNPKAIVRLEQLDKLKESGDLIRI